MTSSLFRRRLGIRAGYEMLRHRQLKMDRLNVSVPIQTDDGGMIHDGLVWDNSLCERNFVNVTIVRGEIHGMFFDVAGQEKNNTF